MTQQRLDAIQNQIKNIQNKLMEVGTMRPGSLTKQMQRRSTTEKVFEYWQLSYTHKMKSKSDYVRQDMVKTTQVRVKEFKRFKKLIDEWIDLAIEQAKLLAKNT